ncbi:MAG: pantoate--beta-alanine ligase [Alphaproteobacteria bacterium]
MQIIESIEKWKNIRKSLSKYSIGFVPTMGNLHEGHMSLIGQSVKENNITILSIFVNPTQFNNKEDLLNYPKTLDNDIKYAQKAKVDYLILPKEEEIYTDNFAFKISNHSSYSAIMEGKFRPSHFTGMLTIVLKLLLLVKPNKAYFGEKDYQQFLLVKEMAKAFFLDTEIISCFTIRNQNGLPLSSRNNRLTEEELKKAALFSQLLKSELKDEEIIQKLEAENFTVDYIEEYQNRRYGAVSLNNVRLIDNAGVK